MNAKACKRENGIWDSRKKICFNFYKNVPTKEEAKKSVDLLTFVFIGTCGGKYRKSKKGYDVYARHWV